MSDIVVSQKEKTWACALHLSALLALIRVPFGQVIGPLLVWVYKKDQSAFVNAHGKSAMNFQISVSIYIIIAFIFRAVPFGAVLLPVLVFVDFGCVLFAAMKAYQGENFRYPISIPLIK